MMAEGPPGAAIDRAVSTIRRHASGEECAECRRQERGTWCPSAEWALWVVVSDGVPTEIRHMVTVVARQVMLAHWPRLVDGCRPCESPNCGRAQLAGTWLDVVKDPFHPPVEERSALGVLLAGSVPSPDELREITGMDHPSSGG